MTPEHCRELTELFTLKFDRLQSDFQDLRSGFHNALEVTTESLRGDLRALSEKFELRMDRVDTRLDGLTERVDGVDTGPGVLTERIDRLIGQP